MTAGSVSDLELLRRIKGGDQAAFSALVDRFWQPLVGFASRLGGYQDDAEDAVQAVLIRVWEKRETWEVEGSVRALLFRMTRDAVFDLGKAKARRLRRDGVQVERSTGSVPTPADELECSDLETALAAAVADLSERRRAVYQLTRVDGLSYREAAQVLGISSQTAANHLSAALAELYRSLQLYLRPDSAGRSAERPRERSGSM
jgi:RNA polymerase sigma-70 factor (ECF subfamily)